MNDQMKARELLAAEYVKEGRMVSAKETLDRHDLRGHAEYIAIRAIDTALRTARVFLTECRSRRHGHGFWFAFRGAQAARRRAMPVVPTLPAQMELFV